jgi:hypothetical protein
LDEGICRSLAKGMKQFNTAFILISLLVLYANNNIVAHDKSSDSTLGAAVSNATNPLAFVTKLQVQPNFVGKDDHARQLALTTKIIKPTGKVPG